MKQLLLLLYKLLRWILLAIIIIILFLLFFIEHPAVILEVAKSPLKELGIEYGEVKGGLLSGFEISDINYQNSIKAKKVGLKVDFKKLEKRVLHIQALNLENLIINKTYLSKLIETNTSKEENEDNISLPFDKIIVDRANISISSIKYKNYFLNSMDLEVKNFKSDLKQQYIGDIYLLLDSNITKLDLNASVNSKKVNISSTIKLKSDFLYDFSKDYNITFISNPTFGLRIKGDIDNKVNYKLETYRLELTQNEHKIDTKKLLLFGSYHVASKDIINHIDTKLNGSFANLSLIADTTLNIEDINNTLEYQADLNATIPELFLNNLLREQNVSFFSPPKISLKSEGNFNHLNYDLVADRLTLNYNEYQLKDAKIKAKGDYSILYKDVTTKINAKFGSNVADPISLDLNAKLNLDDINGTLVYKVDLNTTAQQDFLTQILIEQNLSFFSSPKIELQSQGDFKHLTYHLNVDGLSLKQNEYEVSNAHILADGDYSILHKDVTTKINAQLGSNVADPFSMDLEAKLNLDDINGTLNYKVNVDTNAKEEFLSSVLQEQNITFLSSPHIELQSQGDFKHFTYNLMLNSIALKQNEYEITDGDFSAHGDYSVLDKDVTTVIKTTIYSNIAEPIDVDLDAKLNLDDINNTLVYTFHANITPQKSFIQSKIPDNLYIHRVAPLDIVANGTLSHTEFKVNFEHLSASREGLDAQINMLLLQGESNILTGKTIVDSSTQFNSTAGRGHIKDHATLNFNDIENSLKYDARIEVDADSGYINTLLTDKSLEIQGTPKLKIALDGSMTSLSLKLDAKAEVMKDKMLSNLTITTSPIHLNLKEHTVDGNLKIKSDSKNLGLNFDTTFSGDYTKPESLKISGDMQMGAFNAFGINLDSLAPINVKIENGENGSQFTITSKRINLIATTTDQDHFEFTLDTGKLYLYKMMELPEALDHKYIKLDIAGEATLSTQHFQIDGDLFSNKKFHATINAKNDTVGLNATLKTNYLLLNAKGDMQTKNIEVTLFTASLSDLQRELHALYAFKKVEIEGAITAKLKMRGEDIYASLNSQRLDFDGYSIENIALDALYRKELLTLNRLNFNITGFEDDRLNRKFYLNQKGLIYLGDRRDVLIDMHPNILVKMKGDKEYLEGDFKITKVPLGHPSYGSMVLTTDIHYLQEGKRKTITGDIFLKKMKLFYEAKFLDADNDSDVIIITKKDKLQEQSEDDFLENTSISLNIHAPEANYKTPDIDLLFDIKVDANKAFGTELSLMGKIEEINGRYDQVPKRFKIVHSNVVFKGGKKINPLLDIYVEYELPQVLIKINVGGSAQRPKIEFSSEPPMPKKDILSYLLLGVSTANFANGEGSVSREAELFIINQAARDLAYEADFDRVFVKDDGTGEGFAIEVGKKVSPKNMIIIETSKQGNSIILEHDITKNLKLRVGHHQKEKPSQSIDIFFRKRFK